jgi:hypothetical protein
MANSNDNGLVLADLVEAAFDRARTVTSDPEVAAMLASRTMGRWLARSQRIDLIQKWEGMSPGPKRPARRIARPAKHRRAA